MFNTPIQLDNVGTDALHTLRFPAIYLCGDIYITIEDNAIVLVLSDPLENLDLLPLLLEYTNTPAEKYY